MVQSTILSGNLSTSDAADVINIPRVSNATNNAILTNVNGDANNLICESNLTFDGNTLNVAGDITASAGASFLGPVNISSSAGLTITGSIFPSGSTVFDLGSATQRWGALFVGTGSVHLGPDCSIGSIPGGIVLNKSTFVTGAISASLNISASAFYGDGSHLTNVLADHVVAEGPAYSIQFHDSSDGDLTGSSNLIFSSNVLSVSGGIVFNRIQTTANMTASATDYFIAINTNSNPVDVRLPSAALLASGQTYVIKDEGGAASSNNITVLASGSQTIDGQNSIVLESPYASIQLYCNGSDKYFIF
tara:strand:- start:476 stop:1390 length:915 start_codon:yes stop_codon:yes gene_type:complete